MNGFLGNLTQYIQRTLPYRIGIIIVLIIASGLGPMLLGIFPYGAIVFVISVIFLVTYAYEIQQFFSEQREKEKIEWQEKILLHISNERQALQVQIDQVQESFIKHLDEQQICLQSYIHDCQLGLQRYMDGCQDILQKQVQSQGDMIKNQITTSQNEIIEAVREKHKDEISLINKLSIQQEKINEQRIFKLHNKLEKLDEGKRKAIAVCQQQIVRTIQDTAIQSGHIADKHQEAIITQLTECTEKHQVTVKEYQTSVLRELQHAMQLILDTNSESRDLLLEKICTASSAQKRSYTDGQNKILMRMENIAMEDKKDAKQHFQDVLNAVHDLSRKTVSSVDLCKQDVMNSINLINTKSEDSKIVWQKKVMSLLDKMEKDHNEKISICQNNLSNQIIESRQQFETISGRQKDILIQAVQESQNITEKHGNQIIKTFENMKEVGLVAIKNEKQDIVKQMQDSIQPVSDTLQMLDVKIQQGTNMYRNTINDKSKEILTLVQKNTEKQAGKVIQFIQNYSDAVNSSNKELTKTLRSDMTVLRDTIEQAGIKTGDDIRGYTDTVQNTIGILQESITQLDHHQDIILDITNEAQEKQIALQQMISKIMDMHGSLASILLSIRTTVQNLSKQTEPQIKPNRVETFTEQDTGNTIYNTFKKNSLIKTEVKNKDTMIYAVEYDEQGNPTVSQNYKDGELQSEVTYYRNGQIETRKEIIRRNGRKHVEVSHFDEDGNKIR